MLMWMYVNVNVVLISGHLKTLSCFVQTRGFLFFYFTCNKFTKAKNEKKIRKCCFRFNYLFWHLPRMFSFSWLRFLLRFSLFRKICWNCWRWSEWAAKCTTRRKWHKLKIHKKVFPFFVKDTKNQDETNGNKTPEFLLI